MNHRLQNASSRALTIGTLAVVLLMALAVALGFGPLGGPKEMSLRLQFDEATSLYVGDKVTVLDVPIGEVTSIRPRPDRVDVEVKVDGGTPLPADARAVLVAPSLVSIRHIDLTPYQGGARLSDDATIPMARTASPVEWDKVKEQLSRLTEALGPRGANQDGAVTRLLTVSASNLSGRGADMKATLDSLSKAMTTLSQGGDDLFATVRNLQVFTTALDQSQAQIVDFNRRFANVTESLDADKGQLAAVLRTLADVFPELQSFLKENRADLVKAVDEFRVPAGYIANQRQNLADILQVVPGALSNFYNILDPDIPGPTGSIALANFSNTAELICAMSYSLGGTPAQCVNLLQPIAKYLNLGAPPLGLIPILRDGRDNVAPPPGAPARSSATVDPAAPGESTPEQSSVGSLANLLSGLTGGSR